jgi:hypothetical protein
MNYKSINKHLTRNKHTKCGYDFYNSTKQLLAEFSLDLQLFTLKYYSLLRILATMLIAFTLPYWAMGVQDYSIIKTSIGNDIPQNTKEIALEQVPQAKTINEEEIEINRDTFYYILGGLLAICVIAGIIYYFSSPRAEIPDLEKRVADMYRPGEVRPIPPDLIPFTQAEMQQLGIPTQNEGVSLTTEQINLDNSQGKPNTFQTIYSYFFPSSRGVVSNINPCIDIITTQVGVSNEPSSTQQDLDLQLTTPEIEYLTSDSAPLVSSNNLAALENRFRILDELSFDELDAFLLESLEGGDTTAVTNTGRSSPSLSTTSIITDTSITPPTSLRTSIIESRENYEGPTLSIEEIEKRLITLRGGRPSLPPSPVVEKILDYAQEQTLPPANIGDIDITTLTLQELIAQGFVG